MTATPIAKLVRDMAAAGAPVDAIAVAVEAIESVRGSSADGADASADGADASADASADARSVRLERDRIRNRNNRATKRLLREAAKANDVAARPQSSVDASVDESAERCSLSSSLLPSVASLGSKKRSSEPRARGTRLTDDWQPRDEDRDFVRGLGVDPAALRDEFVDFWTAVPGSRGLKLDWYKTYKNRAREVAGRRKGKNGKSIIDAQDRLNSKLAEFSEPDLLGGVRREAGSSDVRLLPARRSG